MYSSTIPAALWLVGRVNDSKRERLTSILQSPKLWRNKRAPSAPGVAGPPFEKYQLQKTWIYSTEERRSVWGREVMCSGQKSIWLLLNMLIEWPILYRVVKKRSSYWKQIWCIYLCTLDSMGNRIGAQIHIPLYAGGLNARGIYTIGDQFIDTAKIEAITTEGRNLTYTVMRAKLFRIGQAEPGLDD